MCLCTSLFAFWPSAVQSQTSPETSGSLPGGGSFIMRADPLASTTAMDLWFRTPAAGTDERYPGIARLALTALAASSAPHGTSLSELVNRFGGSLTITVYPDIAMVGVSVPSWDAPQVLRTLTGTYFAPSISSAGLKAALRDCAIAAAQTRFDTQRVLQNALFAQLFVSGPAHEPPTPASIAYFTKIPQSTLASFARTAFRQSNAVLTLAGGVDSQLLGSVQRFGSGGQPSAPYDSTRAPAPHSVSITSAISGIGFAWAGPPIADAKSATALDFVADYLFDADHGTLARAIQRQNAGVFVNGQFITLHDPGVLLLAVSGADTPAIRKQIRDAITAMEKPMDAALFDAARNAFEYHIFSQTQTPMSRAETYGWYAAEGNAAYAPGDASGQYLELAQSLDPGYVAQAVRTYLQHPVVVHLIAEGKKGTTT